MPLFDLNNLEHTSCQNGSCGNDSTTYLISDIDIESIINNPISRPKETKVVVEKLTRKDFQ